MSLVDLGKRLLESAKLGETEEVRLLMSNGAPFTTDWLGSSPLHMAAQYGHLATAEVLLRAGISKDARTKVDRTPLHIAAQEGHVDIVELLIKHGAEVDAKDMLRMTPLHWAVERGHMKVILCLLKHNADTNSLNKFNKTPFDIAEYNHQKEIIEVLEYHTTNPARSKDSTTTNKPVQLLPLPSAVNPVVKKAVPVTSKTDSLSALHVENANKSTTNSPTIVTAAAATSGTPTSTENAKSSSQRPILLQANLAHIQKAAAAAVGGTTKTISSDSEEGDSSDQSCTNVLATLAALAEATAPNATISTSEALQWLESHGITMLPTDNSTVVASAIESGHTVALTEAGKLALNWVRDNPTLHNSTEVPASAQEKTENGNLPNTSNNLNQKVITIVADHSQLPSIISQQAPIVVMGSQSVQSAAAAKTNESPPVKRIKTIVPKKEQIKSIANGKVSSTELSPEEERLKLQRELEKIKKEAELYKVQLLQKAREAEQYRKQLEEMRGMSQSN